MISCVSLIAFAISKAGIDSGSSLLARLMGSGSSVISVVEVELLGSRSAMIIVVSSSLSEIRFSG
jgi:hypothetical protein